MCFHKNNCSKLVLFLSPALDIDDQEQVWPGHEDQVRFGA